MKCKLALKSEKVPDILKVKTLVAMAYVGLVFISVACSFSSPTESEPNSPNQGPATGTIVGTIRLSGTNSQFVDGVTVTIAGKSDVTGSVGAYWIDRIPAGSHAITATADGYDSYSGTVQVVAGSSIRYDFSMTRMENTVELYAVADTYTNSYQTSAFMNYGSEQGLNTGTINLGASGDANYRAFIRFDINSIPQNANILSASLILVVANDAAPTKPTGTTVVQRVAGPAWTESGLTYFNSPSVFLAHLDEQHVIFRATANVEWNVTDAVRKWVNNNVPNYGFAVTTTNINTSYDYGTFYSREVGGGGAVRLVIRYN